MLPVTYNYEMFLGACNNVNVRDKNKYKTLLLLTKYLAYPHISQVSLF
jgi:hypothetical protein